MLAPLAGAARHAPTAHEERPTGVRRPTAARLALRASNAAKGGEKTARKGEGGTRLWQTNTDRHALRAGNAADGGEEPRLTGLKRP